jgi:hypothetical protein
MGITANRIFREAATSTAFRFTVSRKLSMVPAGTLADVSRAVKNIQ